MELGTITEGPSLFKNVAKDYFELVDGAGIAADAKLITELTQSLSFEIETRFFITVPVYAGDRLLENYLDGIRPALNNRHFNICVFVNATQDKFSEPDFENARAYHAAVITKFNQECGFAAACLLTAYLPGPVSMGRVRKLLVDSILRYCIEKDIDEPVILCNDVDLIASSPAYLAEIANEFSQNITPVFVAAPIGYGYKGKIAMGLPAGIHVPELYLFNRVQDAINLCTRDGRIGSGPAIWPEGANFAFAGSAYCAAGGFDPMRTTGEDDAMGFALKGLWANGSLNNPTLNWQAPVYNSSAWIVTDPRRVLAAIQSGRTGIEAWAWQSFTENPGSEMDTHALAIACNKKTGLLRAENLIQFSAIERNKNWEFVTDRIGWLFCRSVVFDRRARDLEQFKAVAKAFGLVITDGILNYEPLEFEANIDWDQSTLLGDLVDTFQ